MEYNEAFSSEAFNRLLKRIVLLENIDKACKLRKAALELDSKKEKEASNKRISSLKKKVNVFVFSKQCTSNRIDVRNGKLLAFKRGKT